MRRVLALLVAVAAATLLAPSSAHAAESTHWPVQFVYTSTTGSLSTTATFDFDTTSNRVALKERLDWTLGAEGTSGVPVMPLGVDGNVRCNQSYGWYDLNGEFTYQHRCGTTTAAWGYKFSSQLRSIVTSAVTEQGMDWWRNGAAMPRQAPHVVPEDYHFHGTFNPVDDNDAVRFTDHFYFRVNVGGNTGNGHLQIAGALQNIR